LEAFLHNVLEIYHLQCMLF